MTDWIVRTVELLSYWGIALLMFLENVLPPIPSEVVMPLAGFTAGQGDLTLWGAILAGSAGSLAGATLWYAVARAVGTDRLKGWADRHGRWLRLRRRDIDRADRWFDRWGHWAVLLGHIVPGVRTLISLPAGFSEMPFGRFLLYSLIGTVAWCTLLASLGWALGGHWTVIERYVGWIGLGITVILLAAAAAWVWRRHRETFHRAT